LRHQAGKGIVSLIPATGFGMKIAFILNGCHCGTVPGPAVEYYSPLKSNEVLMNAMTWMDLETLS
jgi:hypothetical protein